MLLQPATHGRGGVDRRVVDDNVHFQVVAKLSLDGCEEAPEVGGALARVALADDLARYYVERSEEVGRAVTQVSVRVALGLSEGHRQHRLVALQRLHLCLLVEAQHHGVLGRAHVQTDDVAYFLDEEVVAAERESPATVGLELESAPHP
jgi:hypothetical protein